jgi:hypothetical protein
MPIQAFIGYKILFDFLVNRPIGVVEFQSVEVILVPCWHVLPSTYGASLISFRAL